MNENKKSKGDLKIAGNLTVDDWDALKKHLICGKPDNWKLAYNSFFLTRIQTRYFDPIETLIKHGGEQGEGFSIVALQCSLIEFLASTLKGRNYKYCGKGDKCSDFEYCRGKGKEYFIDFLLSQHPFNKYFDEKKACDFYKNVRCALLHEARTKSRWKIHANNGDKPSNKGNKFIDYSEKIIYRNNLQIAFIEFVEDYGKKLPQCKELQCAFIRKFDGLCVE